MKRTQKMNKAQYERYLKSHQYDFPEEEESGKIRNEKAQSKDYERVIEKDLDSILGTISSSHEDTLEIFLDEIEQLEILEFKNKKIRNNARTHKNRLKEIKRHQDNKK